MLVKRMQTKMAPSIISVGILLSEAAEGVIVGAAVGPTADAAVGVTVAAAVGVIVCAAVGATVCAAVGATVGAAVGVIVGAAVGADVGALEFSSTAKTELKIVSSYASEFVPTHDPLSMILDSNSSFVPLVFPA